MFADLYSGHENVVFCQDEHSGLRAIIAIHSTTLGPAAGGCRRYAYASVEAALTDVLRLSRAMTWKNALAGLPLGGGKSVIIANPGEPVRPQTLEAFGRHIERLGGAYWTAEDVGIGLESVERIGRTTQYVFGTSVGPAATGDPSIYTARGVYAGIRATAKARFGRDDLSGLTVAVQGVGSVGAALCRLLRAGGAELVIADPNAEAVAGLGAEIDAKVVGVDAILDVEADILAPCALGGPITPDVARRLKVGAVAGAANNVLSQEMAGAVLAEREILYAPDFVVNAGGMIHASCEILGRHDVTAVNTAIERIYQTTADIFARATAEGARPEEVALALAQERVASGRAV